MAADELTTTRKALTINLNDSIYGAFAEIGAGQEVARHFFKAGRASHTIAKTMSAYDMTISDEIYGKAGRYVCEERLLKMLEHEFDLLEGRLREQRGHETCFFAFADTVATSSQQDGPRCHGWMGVRFQIRPGGPTNDVVLHVNMLDQMRLDQQTALGILGVNLIYAAFNQLDGPSRFVGELADNLGSHRMEIDLLKFSGPDLEHVDNRLVGIELVEQGLSKAVLFGPQGEVLQAADSLYQKPLVVQRGTFRPVTKINVEILNRGVSQVHLLGDLQGQEPMPIMEISLKSLLSKGGEVDRQDFLNRIETLTLLGYPVLISRYPMFYELKRFLRSCTQNVIGFVIGASHVEKIFHPEFYSSLSGGLMEGMGRLFDEKTGFLVYPFKSDTLCLTAGAFHPSPQYFHLFCHLTDNGRIIDMAGCDDIDTSIHSEQVRQSMEDGDPSWKNLVPNQVAQLIETKKMFQV
ncbi:MAG: hypothetical protein H6624_00390 [Bdellovibrionaceae bacterium]|nr:hypothetical protein [Bdellovibrionales bacterium]MCB9082765.1 hypothetical protein [Pseudobdellovibrionaceae bacterium]